MMWSTFLIATITWIIFPLAGSQRLPEYVTSECYGNSFNFECGQGHKIRINRDFFGHSSEDICGPSINDCVVTNQKTDSLIHRYCTGKRRCPYFQVERRACNGMYTNYQQVEYQCVPDNRVVDICQNIDFETREVFISSTNFPQNYPPRLDCSCFVSSSGGGALVHLEVVYMSILYSYPCRDWLRVGRTRMCGITVDLFSGQHIPLEFHSDREGGHSGFWLHMQVSKSDASLYIRCRNSTLRSMFSEQRSRSNTRPSRIQNVFTSPLSPRTKVSPLPNKRTDELPSAQSTNQPSSNRPSSGVRKPTNTRTTYTRESMPSTVSKSPVGSDTVRTASDITKLGNLSSHADRNVAGNEKEPTIANPTDFVDSSQSYTPVNHGKTSDSNVNDQRLESDNPFTGNTILDIGENQNMDDLISSEDVGTLGNKPETFSPPDEQISSSDGDHTVHINAESKYHVTYPYYNNYDTESDYADEHDRDETDIIQTMTMVDNLDKQDPDKPLLNFEESTFPATLKPGDGMEDLYYYNNVNGDIQDGTTLHTVHSLIPSIPDYHNTDLIENRENQPDRRMTTPPVTFNIQKFIQRKLNGTNTGFSNDHGKIKQIYSMMNKPLKTTTKDIGGDKTKPPDILNQLNKYDTAQNLPVIPSESKPGDTNDVPDDRSTSLDRDLMLNNWGISDSSKPKASSDKSSSGIYPDSTDKITTIGTEMTREEHLENSHTLQTDQVEGRRSGFPRPIDHSVDKGSGTSTHRDINGASAVEPEQIFNKTQQKGNNISSHQTIPLDGHLQDPTSRQPNHVGVGGDLQEFNTLTTGNSSVNSLINPWIVVTTSSGGSDNPISLPEESNEQSFLPRNDMINAGLSPRPEHAQNINEGGTRTNNPVGNYPYIVPTQYTQSHINNTQMGPKGLNYDKSNLFDPLDSPINKNKMEGSQFPHLEDTTPKKYTPRKKSSLDMNSFPTIYTPQNKLKDNASPSLKSVGEPTENNQVEKVAQLPDQNIYYYYDHYFEPSHNSESTGDKSGPEDRYINTDATIKDNVNIMRTENNKKTTTNINDYEPGIPINVEDYSDFNQDVYPPIENYGNINDEVEKITETSQSSKNKYGSQFDNSKNPHFVDHTTNEAINLMPVKLAEPRESSSPGDIQTPGDRVQSYPTTAMADGVTTRLDASYTEGSPVEDSNTWDVTHADEESRTRISPRDNPADDKTVLLGGEGTDRTQDSNSSDVTTEGTVELLDSSFNEEDSIVTLGLIILSVCIGAGIILLSCFFIAILWHRRRRRVAAATAQHPTLAIIHAQKEMLHSQQTDGDSGRSLLVHAQKTPDSDQIDSYARGRGHQSVLDVDSMYTKPKKMKKDRMLQIDMTDTYEDVAIHTQKKQKAHTINSKSFVAPGVAPYVINHNNSGGKTDLHIHEKELYRHPKVIIPPVEYRKQGDVFMMPSSTYTLRTNMAIPTIEEEEFETDQPTENQQHENIKPNIPPKPKFLTNKTNIADVTASMLPFESSKNSSVTSDMKQKTIASMPGLSEVTFMPENSPVYYEVEDETFSEEDDSDWETRSAISL